MELASRMRLGPRYLLKMRTNSIMSIGTVYLLPHMQLPTKTCMDLLEKAGREVQNDKAYHGSSVK